MKSLLLAIVILFQSFFIKPVNVKPIIPRGEELQHSATHRIRMKNIVEGAGCSATAVGPHTLLTASHCLVPSNEIQIDGDMANIVHLTFDDNDHMLIQVNKGFASYLPIVSRDLVPNEVVHMWGNPGASRDVYRIGVFEKADDDTEMFIMPGAPGDSGSGIMDESGHIVAVLSVGNDSGEVGAFQMGFTPAQLAGIQ